MSSPLMTHTRSRDNTQYYRIVFATIMRVYHKCYALVEGNNCDLGKVEKLCLQYRVPVWNKYQK